jgi:hypothetical protein
MEKERKGSSNNMKRKGLKIESFVRKNANTASANFIEKCKKIMKMQKQ